MEYGTASHFGYKKSRFCGSEIDCTLDRFNTSESPELSVSALPDGDVLQPTNVKPLRFSRPEFPRIEIL